MSAATDLRTMAPTRAIPGATAAIRSRAGSRSSIRLRTAIRESNSKSERPKSLTPGGSGSELDR
jgi:hypothetical protein